MSCCSIFFGSVPEAMPSRGATHFARGRSLAREAQGGDRPAGRRAHPTSVARRAPPTRVTLGADVEAFVPDRAEHRARLARDRRYARGLVHPPRADVPGPAPRRRGRGHRGRGETGAELPAGRVAARREGPRRQTDVVPPLRDVGGRHHEHQDRQVRHQGQPAAARRARDPRRRREGSDDEGHAARGQEHASSSSS